MPLKTETPKEKATYAKIKRLVDAHRPRVTAYRPVPSMYGGRFIDYVGCAYGYYFAVEAKRPKHYATDAQYHRLKEIERAGGAAFEINDPLSLQHFADWLNWCRANPLTVPNWPRLSDRD